MALVLAGCAADEPTPMAAEQPKRVLGLEPGWELVPGGAKYTAVQKGGEVTITARGESPKAGYEVKLVPSPLRIWPPQYLLAHKKPEGVAAQVITPFEVLASFKADQAVKSVKVTDGAGGHHVEVERE
jgi:hypothetical protein